MCTQRVRRGTGRWLCQRRRLACPRQDARRASPLPPGEGRGEGPGTHRVGGLRARTQGRALRARVLLLFAGGAPELRAGFIWLSGSESDLSVACCRTCRRRCWDSSRWSADHWGRAVDEATPTWSCQRRVMAVQSPSSPGLAKERPHDGRTAACCQPARECKAVGEEVSRVRTVTYERNGRTNTGRRRCESRGLHHLRVLEQGEEVASES